LQLHVLADGPTPQTPISQHFLTFEGSELI